jgi:hypothetical protein
MGRLHSHSFDTGSSFKIGGTIPAPLGRLEVITRELREIVQDNSPVPELEPGVGDVAKLTEGYDSGSTPTPFMLFKEMEVYAAKERSRLTRLAWRRF